MPTNLISYTLHLADNALILGHRNSEWTGHGPILEQDIALSNIALDLVGQARNFYQYAASLINQDGIPPLPGMEKHAELTEDHLAYHRDVRDFKNFQLVEQPNGDWAQTILRQFFFSSWQYYFYSGLQKSNDEQLAAIAEKSVKETTYHLRWSSEWVIRLGDGTSESHKRMLKAIESLQKFTSELFSPADYELAVLHEGAGLDITLIKEPWHRKVKEIFDEATLPFEQKSFFVTNGKNGFHSEHLGFLLAEMQFLQRAYPDATW